MPDPHTTPHGSPCAKSWTPDWITVVEAKEHTLDRPICGARLMSGNPCTLVSTHASGRCRYHGGFDLTGAPAGNRNAVLHNLYSRRLMPCGSHCPVWQSCPLGGGAKDQGASIIELDQANRPTCPYEQTEYNAAVTDALERVPKKRTYAYGRHTAHMLALAQVMLTRAGLALRQAEFTKATIITGEKYHMTTPKVSPALTAYEKLDRAYRLLLNDFERHYGQDWDRPIDEEAYETRIQSDTALDPDTQAAYYDAMPPPGPIDWEDEAYWEEEDEMNDPGGTDPPTRDAKRNIPSGRTSCASADEEDLVPPKDSHDEEDPWIELGEGHRIRKSEQARQRRETSNGSDARSP